MIIELGDLPPPFHADLWLHKGLKYPDNPPLEVWHARQKLLKIPTVKMELLPSVDITVSNFLLLPLPDEDKRLNMTSPITCSSSRECSRRSGALFTVS